MNGQWVYEKMLSFTNHLGNENQNLAEIAPHSSKNDYYQKGKREQVVSEDVEKKELVHTVGGNAN
jgi:hypothetical protein